MTGAEHYREAEKALEAYADAIDGGHTLCTAEQSLAEAQAHATLALAAAEALKVIRDMPMGGETSEAWRQAIGHSWSTEVAR